MTIPEIRALLVSVDPHIGMYDSEHREGEAYTRWEPVRRLETISDDMHEEAWSFQVDRFTKDDEDGIADALFAALDSDDRIGVEHLIDYEADTGYIHHIFDCEAV
jgi:hypothetical protein